MSLCYKNVIVFVFNYMKPRQDALPVSVLVTQFTFSVISPRTLLLKLIVTISRIGRAHAQMELLSPSRQSTTINLQKMNKTSSEVQMLLRFHIKICNFV